MPLHYRFADSMDRSWFFEWEQALAHAKSGKGCPPSLGDDVSKAHIEEILAVDEHDPDYQAARDVRDGSLSYHGGTARSSADGTSYFDAAGAAIVLEGAKYSTDQQQFLLALVDRVTQLVRSALLSMCC